MPTIINDAKWTEKNADGTRWIVQITGSGFKQNADVSDVLFESDSVPEEQALLVLGGDTILNAQAFLVSRDGQQNQKVRVRGEDEVFSNWVQINS
ncbi:MAG: hypothetical protein ABJL72_08565 [Roseobacter sp.]